MHVTELKLTDFRNIESTSLKIEDSKAVVLFGENGAGKTNVMEALSLLTPGRGLHKHPRDAHVRHNQARWTIFAEVSANDEHQIGLEFHKSKTTLKIDGEVQAKQSALSHFGNVLWFTPKMDRLFMDGAAGRREFLDRLVFGHFPEHAEQLSRYKHHIKARLKLLKDRQAADWVAIEEQQAAKWAGKIVENRHKYLEALKPYLTQCTLEVSGRIEEVVGDDFAILEGFASRRERDAMLGATHFGPHRSKVEGQFIATDTPLEETSTGQHKKAVLDIILAAAKLSHSQGRVPLILLDEVGSHLDKKVRTEFFGTLKNLGVQVWLSGTEKELFEDLPGALLIQVENGNFKIV